MLRRYAGGAEAPEAAGATAAAALEDLCRRHPDLRVRLLDGQGALYPYFHLFRNGERLERAALAGAALREGDRLEVLAAASGG
jgi:sulfur carrier protein ThiS